MTYPTDLVRITYGFDTGTPAYEKAQFGFWLRFEDDISGGTWSWDTATNDAATKMATAFNSYWAAVRGQFCTSISPTFCKATHIDTNGHALDVATAPLTTDNGTSGAPCLPFEVSMAVTLYGYDPGHFVPNSRRRRGRFYLPPMVASIVDINGLWTAAAMDVQGNALDAFLEDVQGKRVNAGPLGADAGYWRLVTVSQVGEGRWDQVFAHAIGNTPDSQRRRRNALPETYRTMALSAS